MSRRAFVDIELNGNSVTADLSGDTISVSYTDNATDENVDDISITIQNRTKKWLYGWFPNTSDTLKVKIITEEWTGGLDCGGFILDDVDMGGWPLTVSMKALAMPVNSAFSEVRHNKTWESAQLKEVASTLAGNSSIPLEYEAAYNPLLKFVSQTDKTDRLFLHELCQKYGLTMKMYSNRIIIYDMAEFEKNAGVVTLTEMSMTSFKAKSTITDAGYTGCTVKYTDKNGKILEYAHTVKGKTPKIFLYTVQVSDLAEAERVAKAKLRELNMGETTFSCTIPGNTNTVAGMCVNISGFGNFDGKYFIDSAVHKVGGGYTTNLTMHRVLLDG